MQEAERIAAGLTKAQREIILSASTPTSIKRAWEIRASRSMRALKARGIAEHATYNSLTGQTRFYEALTPLGLEVRRILSETPHAE